MRPRTLTALAAAALAVAVPAAITQAAPQSGAAEHAAMKKVSVVFSLDGPGITLAPVEGQEGTYTLTQRLWSNKQNVQWFTAGPPPAMGSVPVTKFAALLAKDATTDEATAPVADVSYVQSGKTKHFLATVSAAGAGLGTRKAPVHTATLSPLSPERLQKIASGKGLLSKIAARCALTISACPAPGTRMNTNARVNGRPRDVPTPIRGQNDTTEIINGVTYDCQPDGQCTSGM